MVIIHKKVRINCRKNELDIYIYIFNYNLMNRFSFWKTELYKEQ